MKKSQKRHTRVSKLGKAFTAGSMFAEMNKVRRYVSGKGLTPLKQKLKVNELAEKRGLFSHAKRVKMDALVRYAAKMDRQPQKRPALDIVWGLKRVFKAHGL